MTYYLFNCVENNTTLSYIMETEIESPTEAFKDMCDKLKLQPRQRKRSLKLLGFQTISNSEFSLLNKNNFATDFKSELKYDDDDVISIGFCLLSSCSESEIREIASIFNCTLKNDKVTHRPIEKGIIFSGMLSFTLICTVKSYNKFVNYFNERIGAQWPPKIINSNL